MLTGGPLDCAPVLRAAGLDGMADWAEERPIRHGWKGRTCREIWDSAPRGDQLLGYAEAAGADRRDIVRAAAACVRPALRFVSAGEDRPRLAIEAAELWADDPTHANRRRASVAGLAASVAGSASFAVGDNAAWSAGRAAQAAGFAAGVAGGAAKAVAAGHAFVAAGRAAYADLDATKAAGGSDDDAYAALGQAHAACADEVRRLVPFLDLSAPR